jgi:hypothetical protein
VIKLGRRGPRRERSDTKLRLWAAIAFAGFVLATPGCTRGSAQPGPDRPEAARDEHGVPPWTINVPGVEMPSNLAGKPCTTGWTVVDGLVELDGRIVRPHLVRTSGATSFDDACLSSSYRYLFVPATQAGRPVEASVRIPCGLECE